MAKTLKEIDISDGDDEKFVERFDLKIEASKWIEEIENGETEWVDDGSLKEFIMKFFNLTDDELIKFKRNF